MANQKPKKSGKKAEKSTVQPETKKEVKEVKETTAAKEVVTVCEDKPMKGFFARKCDKNENILTIFKTPKIWGALIGEVIGTMLLVVLLLVLSLLGPQPLFLGLGVICIYIAVVGLSGANLNPLVTVGMMATRRMSAIRGVLYILAQLLGGWLAMIIVNAFRIGSGSTINMPVMNELTGETFWAIALIELFGAVVIAFFFARSLRFVRKSPLAFAVTVASGLVLMDVVAYVISLGFFGMSNNAYIFNPVAALMHQILPTTADTFGELAQSAGLAIAAYVLVPMVGGVIGFYLSDISTRLAGKGYSCDIDNPCCEKGLDCCKK